jgi:hypothetical protein
LYGNFVVGSDIGCTIGSWYHGGMNMCELGVGHPKGPTSVLKGGSLSGSLPSELPPSQSLSCPPFDSWWSKPLGMWVSKLVVTCIMVSTSAIIGYWIGCLSLLVSSWTTIGNWLPTEYGIYVSGTTSYSNIGYTFPCT